MFKAEPVDQYGNLIDRHNLWEMVGVRYRRALFPGFSDSAEYTFACPGSSGHGAPALEGKPFSFEAPTTRVAELTITARLLYRKVDQYLLNFLFGEKSGLTTPVTELARSEVRIRIKPESTQHAAAQSGTRRLASLQP
jgi:hypothetical protein